MTIKRDERDMHLGVPAGMTSLELGEYCDHGRDEAARHQSRQQQTAAKDRRGYSSMVGVVVTPIAFMTRNKPRSRSKVTTVLKTLMAELSHLVQ